MQDRIESAAFQRNYAGPKGGRHDLDQESEEKSNVWWTRPRSGAAALTAVAWLTFVSFGLGAVGIGFTILGFMAPNLLRI